MAEIWKKIKYFENYEISNLGKVRNVNHHQAEDLAACGLFHVWSID